MGCKNMTLIISELTIIGLSVLTIVVSYYAILPRFLSGRPTYSVLVAGTLISVLLGGLAVRKFGDLPQSYFNWVLIVGFGLVVGLVVLILSVGLIVTLMGS